MTLQEILQQQEQKEGISGTSTETLEDILRRHGPAPKTPSPVVPEPTTATPAAEEPSFLQQNLDIPYALGGAATLGTLGGMVAGPPGAFAGSVIGGALGSGVGAGQSELLYGSKDPVEAYKEGVEAALWSAGIDLATFGIGSKLKSAWYASKMKSGKSIEEATLEAIDTLYTPGSPESLRLTQQILNRKGATLLPSQILEGGLDGFRERIASVGLISRERMDDNIRAVNDALVDELNGLINKNASGMDVDVSSIGSVFDTVLAEGKDALSTQYRTGLNEVQMGLKISKIATLDSRYLTKPLSAWIKQNSGVIADKQSPAALQFLKDRIARIESAPNGRIPVEELIDFDREFNSLASEMFGKGVNDRAMQSLTEAGNLVRNTIANALQVVDPKAAAKYASMKSAYEEGINTLFPKITTRFVTEAGKGSYKNLGGIATNATNVDVVRAMRKSLAKSIALAKKEGAELSYESFDEVDKLMKEGFLASKLSKVRGTEKANVYQLKNLALGLQNPTQEKIYKEVLGDDFPAFKQLMNAIIETSESASGETGILVLRGLETKGGRGLMQLLTGLGAGGGYAAGAATGAAAGALGVGTLALYVPNVFSKIVTNPQYVNRLIAIKKSGKEKAGTAVDVALNILVSEVIDEMSEQGRAEAARQLEQMLLTQTNPAEAARRREAEEAAIPPPSTPFTQQELITRGGLINPQRAKMKLQQSLQERGMLTAP
jgi:hypothetical protein